MAREESLLLVLDLLLVRNRHKICTRIVIFQTASLFNAQEESQMPKYTLENANDLIIIAVVFPSSEINKLGYNG